MVGMVFLVVAALLYVLESVFWYFAFVAGCPLLFAWINHTQRHTSLPDYLLRRKGSILIVYALFAVSGLAVELVRILPDLWEYSYPLNSSLATLVWIGAVYPLFFWLIFESFVMFSGITGRSSIGALLALGFLILWNDVPNLFLPLWTVNKPEPILMSVLFALGYIFEVIVAVFVYEFLIERPRFPNSAA